MPPATRQPAERAPAAPPGCARTASLDRDLGGVGGLEAAVAGPAEHQRAAFQSGREKRQKRVGRDRRRQFGAKHLLTIIGAGKQPDDVARDHRAVRTDAVAGLHWVRDQRLDLDRGAAPGLRRHANHDPCTHCRSSTQAASVTITSALPLQNEPSLISAIATTCCESASLMRVATRARPARGPSASEITCGCGFFSLKIWIALTWSCCVIGLSTDTVSGTALPFSTSAGMSSVTLPGCASASPRTSRIACRIASGAARASIWGQTEAAAA